MKTFINKRDLNSDVKDRLKKAKTLEELILPFETNYKWKRKSEDELARTLKIRKDLRSRGKKLEIHILNKENDKLKSFLNKKIKEELSENKSIKDQSEKQISSTPNTCYLNNWESETVKLREKRILGSYSKNDSITENRTKKHGSKFKKKIVKTVNFSENDQGVSKNIKILSVTDINPNKSCSGSPVNQIFSFFNILSDGHPKTDSKISSKIPTIFPFETYEKNKENVINYSDLENQNAFKKPDTRLGKTTLIHIENALAERTDREIKKTMTKSRLLVKNMNKIIDSLEDEDEMNAEEINNDSKFVILPNSTFKVAWDIALVFITLYSVITTPIILAFEEFNYNWVIRLDLLFETMFIIDIMISFFTAFHDRANDDLILNNKKIALKYLKGWFLIDFISSLPSNTIYLIIKSIALSTFEYHLHQISYLSRIARILKLFRLLKFIKLLNTDNQIDRIYLIEELNLSSSIKRFIEFAIQLLLFSHILSCIFIFLAGMDSKNWINKADLDDGSSSDIYVASIYFIWTTIFTIGYGDILSVNTYERVFNILIMMVGVLIFSYTVSSLGNMVTTYDKITKRYLNNLNILHDISMKYPQINENNNEDKSTNSSKTNIGKIYENKETLYDKLMKFLNYEYKMNKSEKMKFIDHLPMKIRNELIFKMYKKVIDNFTFFRYSYQDGRNEAFNSRVILNMRPLKVYSNEFVLRDGETLHEMIFIKSGVLSVELPSNYLNQPILALRRNDHYGVISVLNGERSEVNLRVKSKFAELYIIQKNDLVQISVEHPEIFKEILQNSSAFYTSMIELIKFRKQKFIYEKSLIEEKNKSKNEVIKYGTDENQILNNSPPKNQLSPDDDFSLKKSSESRLNILSKKEIKSNVYVMKEKVHKSVRSPGIKNKSKLIEENDINYTDLNKKVSLIEGNTNDSQEKSKSNIIMNIKLNDPDKIVESDNLVNTFDKQPITRDESFIKDANKNNRNRRKSCFIHNPQKELGFEEGNNNPLNMGTKSLFTSQIREKRKLKSSEILLVDDIKDSKILPYNKNSYKFNNLDELIRLPRRHQPISSFCKNAFIECIKKEIESKVNEKINFERNPHGFLLNNLKGLIQRQMAKEKEGFKKVNDKLDELFIYLIKSVDKNCIKNK
jgi:hypothetical protein